MRFIGSRGSAAGSRRVVVAGAGFAGLAAARGLPATFDVSVVDQSTDFDFLPNIHELVSGIKRPAELQLPIEHIVRRAGHAFLLDRIDGIDPERRIVALSTGGELPYDVLVVALGGVNDTYGVPGAEQHALPFKTVANCARIGRVLGALLSRPGPASVVIVGGGLEGVEALGEILRRRADRPQPAVHLVESGPRLLPAAPSSVHEVLESHCRDHEVRLHLGVRVEEVDERQVLLSTGEALPSDMTIWTGGATAPRLLAEAGLSGSAGDWARARPTLQAARHDEVFLAGDAAGLEPSLSKQAYHALDMGALAARNVARSLRGARLSSFKPSSKPVLVSFGELDTFLVAGDRALAGVALAPLKEGVFQLVMAQLDPPVTPRGLLGAVGRAARGVTERGLPAVGSLSSLANLRGVRAL